MSHYTSTDPTTKWQHDQLRHMAAHTSISLDNGQLAYHQTNGYINGNGLYRPTSEFDAVEKKPDIGPSWNPEKVWAENGLGTKLSPSDQGIGIVRTATPSANSTESTPSSVRHSIGPDETESTDDPDHGKSRTLSPEEREKAGRSIKTEGTEHDEASNLLLSFSSRPETTESGSSSSSISNVEKNRLIAMQIEEKILREKLNPEPESTVSESTRETIASVVDTVANEDFELEYTPAPNNIPPKVNSPANATRSRAFFRAPGLGPSDPSPSNGKMFICPICSFSCPSKFHYNSHMNTHGDHQCSMCDYTARTEGRMKKHMRDSHTREEQIAAGLEVGPEPAKSNSMSDDIHATMASIMEVANRAVTGENGPDSAAFGNALESIKALTEGGANGSPGPHTPVKRPSGGKPKKYTCKQCPLVSTSKEDSWVHMKSHIPPEKQLCCPQCEFVTEYKHHLEYHTRNHYAMKPFKCGKCNYSCVNKSMLNSHMKSHSNQYQFQCMDCNYQSKYCHSLKMHLRKYNHRRKPGITVDDEAEAMMNDPSIDGVDVESASMASYDENTINPEQRPSTTNTPATAAPISTFGSALLQPIASTSSMQYANLLKAKQEQMNEILRTTQLLNCTVCEFTCATVDQMVQHNMIHLQQNQSASQNPTNFNAIFQYLQNINGLSNQQQQQSLPNLPFTTSDLLLQVRKQQEQNASIQMPDADPLKAARMENDHHQNQCESFNEDSPISADRCSTSPDNHRELSSTGSANSSSSRKRKSKTGKLEEISQRLQFKNSPEHIDHNGDEVPQLAQPIPISAFRQPFLERSPAQAYSNNCEHCRIGFEDAALYAIHRGYHGYENPLKCNHCGAAFSTALEFNLHLWREKHG